MYIPRMFNFNHFVYVPRMFNFNHCLQKECEIFKAGVRGLQEGASQAVQLGMNILCLSPGTYFLELKFLICHVGVKEE